MKHARIIGSGLVAVLLSAIPAKAQTLGGTLSDAVISGYGQVGWQAATNGDFTNDFSAGFSPLLLFSLGEDFLFESELEFGVSGETTTTTLEYSQLNYLGLENFVITAGKFLVPFGLFGERFHPTWINKLPTRPLIYGDAHGGVAEGASVLPILSDVGVMVRYRKPFESGWGVNLTAWASQGPRAVGGADEHDEPDEEEGDDHARNAAEGFSSDLGDGLLSTDIPSVGFGIAFPDNNANKMLGARLGLVKGPSFEVYAGAFHARYDDASELDVVASHLSLEYRKNNYDFKAEGVWLWQDVAHEGQVEVLNRGGYYVQLARRVGAWEPVVRWSHVLEAKVAGTVASAEGRGLTVGLNFRFEPSIPLKFAYHVDLDGDDHLIIQWAFGF